MRILFLHDNFPAQFGLLGQYLSRNGWEVAFGAARKGAAMPGINVFNYAPHREISDKIHPYAAAYERAVLTGQAVARAALSLKKGGYSPDIILAHSGWGPGLCVGEVWPDAKFVGYFEWFYRRNAPDVVFLNDASQDDPDAQLRSRAQRADPHGSRQFRNSNLSDAFSESAISGLLRQADNRNA